MITERKLLRVTFVTESHIVCIPVVFCLPLLRAIKQLLNRFLVGKEFVRHVSDRFTRAEVTNAVTITLQGTKTLDNCIDFRHNVSKSAEGKIIIKNLGILVSAIIRMGSHPEYHKKFHKVGNVSHYVHPEGRVIRPI